VRRNKEKKEDKTDQEIESNNLKQWSQTTSPRQWKLNRIIKGTSQVNMKGESHPGRGTEGTRALNQKNDLLCLKRLRMPVWLD
jgi:hypothetical protein